MPIDSLGSLLPFDVTRGWSVPTESGGGVYQTCYKIVVRFIRDHLESL